MVAVDLMFCIMRTRGEAEDEGLHQVPLLILTISAFTFIIVALMSGQRQKLEVGSAGVLQLKLSLAFSSAAKTKRRTG